MDPENVDVNLGINKNIIVYYRMAFFAKAAAKKAAALALKNVAKVGSQSIGMVREASAICQKQVKQCMLNETAKIKTDVAKKTAKMKTDLAKVMVKAGENIQKVQGGRKRRRSRKRKRSRKRTRKRRRRKSRKRRRR